VSVSVVVVSYRTGPALERCLGALTQASGVSEIVIVDNGGDAGEPELIDRAAASDARLRIVRGHGNVGFAAACNMGARVATGDVLVFANPDVVLQADAIDRLAAVLRAESLPAIVGGDLRTLDGRPDRGSRRERLTFARALVSYSGLSRLEGALPGLRDFNRHNDPPPTGPTSVGAVSGALMAMRRADFEVIGGFDEGYFLHFDDIDLCRRAEERGWRVLFAPGPHGVHERSTSGVSRAFVTRHKVLGLARYLSKFSRAPVERALAGALGGVVRFVWR
jgi:hypothetical protein